MHSIIYYLSPNIYFLLLSYTQNITLQYHLYITPYYFKNKFYIFKIHYQVITALALGMTANSLLILKCTAWLYARATQSLLLL